MATIGNPSTWDNASDIPAGDAKGQTFTAPWDFNRVEFLLATYGQPPQTVWLIIYAGGASGSTQVAFLETTATDNGWCAIDLATPLVAGSYHATVVNRGTSLAVWTATGDSTYTGGTATVGRGAGGSTQSGDRAFIVTEAAPALTPVSQTLTSTYNVEVVGTSTVSQTLDASYNVTVAVSATSLELTWEVLEYVAPTGEILYHRRTNVFSNSGAGTLNVFWPDLGDPSPLEAGDVVFALAIHNGSILFPEDWNLVGTSGVYSGAQRASLLWKRLTGPVSGTFPVTTGNATAVQLFSFRGGRLGGDPFKAFTIATQTDLGSSASAQVTGFSENNAFLLAIGARNATSSVDDALTFTGATGGTDVTIVDTLYNGNVSAIPLAWYRDADSATDPTAVLTYGSVTGNPTSAIFVLGMVATAPVESSVGTTYQVKQRIVGTVNSTYALKQAVAPQQIAASWNVRTPVTATATLETAWATAARVNPTLATAWNVRIPAATSAPASWKVRAQVSTSAESLWAIKGGLLTTTISPSWQVRPYEAPFVFGYEGPSGYAADTSVAIGQVFTMPVRWNTIELFVATFGKSSASAVFTVYNSASGGTIIYQQTLSFTDNSWVTLTLASPGVARIAGTYRVTMAPAGANSSAWWSHSDDVFRRGYATLGGAGASTQVAGDRVFRVLGDLGHGNWVGPQRTYNTYALASATVNTEWAIGSELARVTSSLDTAWVTSGQAIGTTQSTWDVVGSNQVVAKLQASWSVRPYATPFVWGYLNETDAVTAQGVATWLPGQVFTAPVSFDRVEAHISTAGVSGANVTFTLYNSASGNTIISRQTIFVNHNTWAGISFPRQPVGTYRLGLEGGATQPAWWSNPGSTFSRGFATNFTSPDSGDRLFRITGAIQPVTVARTFNANVVAHVVGLLTSTYSTETTTTVVSNTVETEWVTAGQIRANSEQTWNVTEAVATSLETSYQTLIGIAEDYSTTWATTVAADAEVESSWNTADEVVAPVVDESWTVRQQVVQPLGEQTWRTAKRVAASASATWAVRIPAASSSNSTWVVARQVVVAPVSSTWVLHQQVTKSVAPTWRVTVVASRSLQTTFTVFRPASASLSPSYRVLKTVTRAINPTFNVRVPMSPSALTETWNVRTRVGTSSISSTYELNESGQVVTALPVTYRVSRRVSATRTATWHVRVPFGKTTAMAPWQVRSRVIAPSANTWHVRRPVAQPISQTFRVRIQTGATRPASWKTYAPVPSKTVAGSWNVTRGVQTSKATSFRVLKLASATKGSTWNVRTPVLTDQGTWTWQTLRSGPQVSISTDWKTRDQVATAVSTRWNVESNFNGLVNVVVEMANYRTTTDVRQTRVVAEVPSVRISTEVSGGSRAVPVAANE